MTPPKNAPPSYLLHHSNLHALVPPVAPPPPLDPPGPAHIARPIPKLPGVKTEATEFHFRPPAAQHSNF